MAEALHCSNPWQEDKIMLGTQITPTVWGQLCPSVGLDAKPAVKHCLQPAVQSPAAAALIPQRTGTTSSEICQLPLLFDGLDMEVPATPRLLDPHWVINFPACLLLIWAPSPQRFIRPNRLYPAVVGVAPDVYNPKYYCFTPQISLFPDECWLVSFPSATSLKSHLPLEKNVAESWTGMESSVIWGD